MATIIKSIYQQTYNQLSIQTYDSSLKLSLYGINSFENTYTETSSYSLAKASRTTTISRIYTEGHTYALSKMIMVSLKYNQVQSYVRNLLVKLTKSFTQSSVYAFVKTLGRYQAPTTFVEVDLTIPEIASEMILSYVAESDLSIPSMESFDLTDRIIEVSPFD